jgi:hypothetical protein
MRTSPGRNAPFAAVIPQGRSQYLFHRLTYHFAETKAGNKNAFALNLPMSGNATRTIRIVANAIPSLGSASYFFDDVAFVDLLGGL